MPNLILSPSRLAHKKHSKKRIPELAAATVFIENVLKEKKKDLLSGEAITVISSRGEFSKRLDLYNYAYELCRILEKSKWPWTLSMFRGGWKISTYLRPHLVTKTKKKK